MKFVPKALKHSTSKRLVHCQELEADYTLVDVLYGIRIDGPWNFDTWEGSIPVIAMYLPQLNVSACYLASGTAITPFMRGALARVSRMQYGYDLFPFGQISEEQVLASAVYTGKRMSKFKPNLANLKAVLAGRVKLPREKVSQNHMYHYLIKDIAPLIKLEELTVRAGNILNILDAMIPRNTLTEAFALGILLWVLMAPKQLVTLLNSSVLLEQVFDSPTAFGAVIKEKLSPKMKALQNIVSVDLTPLFEFEVLINRGIGDVDWEKEKENRVNPRLATIDQSVLRDDVNKLFTDLRRLGAKARKIEWANFWAERWLWAPTGSYHSQYDEDKQFVGPVRALQHKFYSLSKMPKYRFEHFESRRPEVVARPSTKYEWGKQRAIYGVDNTSFVMASYGMAGCEEVLEPLFPIGRAAESSRVANRVSLTLKNGVPFCFDFEDFNSQHSNDSMKCVLEEYLNVFGDMLSREQCRAIYWTIKSVDKTMVQDKLRGTYKCAGTMMSGCRLTTFLNTVLNYAYVRALKIFSPGQTLHSGDDVLATVNTYGEVLAMQRGAKEMSIRFQKKKCFLASIAEFLRVDHKLGSGSQYLARSIATLVHSQTDSAIPYDTYELAKSNATRISECKQRGADKFVCDRLESIYLADVEKRFNMKKGQLALALKAHTAFGGNKTNPMECDTSLRVSRIKVKSECEGEAVNSYRTLLPGVCAYAERLAKTFGLKEYIPKLQRAMTGAIFERGPDTKFGVLVDKRELDIGATTRLLQYGMFKGEGISMKFNIARAYGIPAILWLGEGIKADHPLSGAVDKLAALRLWY